MRKQELKTHAETSLNADDANGKEEEQARADVAALLEDEKSTAEAKPEVPGETSLAEDMAGKEREEAGTDAEARVETHAETSLNADDANGKEEEQARADVAAQPEEEKPTAEAKPEVPGETSPGGRHGWQGEGGSRNRCRSKS